MFYIQDKDVRLPFKILLFVCVTVWGIRMTVSVWEKHWPGSAAVIAFCQSQS